LNVEKCVNEWQKRVAVSPGWLLGPSFVPHEEMSNFAVVVVELLLAFAIISLKWLAKYKHNIYLHIYNKQESN
jgi:hypothetical protein